jgi:hypothetical protein
LTSGTPSPANNWVHGGVEQPLWRHTRDAYRGFYYKPAKTFQGTIKSYALNAFTCIYDGTNRYFPTALTRNLPDCTFDGEWIETTPQRLGEELVTGFTNGTSTYAFTTCTDNGDGTVDVAYTNSTDSDPESKRIYLNSITNKQDITYVLEIVDITDNGTSSIDGINVVWGTQTLSDTSISDGDKYSFSGEPDSVTPYIELEVGLGDSVNYTLDISVKEYIGN